MEDGCQGPKATLCVLSESQETHQEGKCRCMVQMNSQNSITDGRFLACLEPQKEDATQSHSVPSYKQDHDASFSKPPSMRISSLVSSVDVQHSHPDTSKYTPQRLPSLAEVGLLTRRTTNNILAANRNMIDFANYPGRYTAPTFIQNGSPTQPYVLVSTAASQAYPDVKYYPRYGESGDSRLAGMSRLAGLVGTEDPARPNSIHGVFTRPSGRTSLRRSSSDTSARLFACPYPDCPKTFPSQSRLQRHTMVHSGLKPFSCGFSGCTKRFSRRDNALQHFRTHASHSTFRSIPCKDQNLQHTSDGHKSTKALKVSCATVKQTNLDSRDESATIGLAKASERKVGSRYSDGLSPSLC